MLADERIDADILEFAPIERPQVPSRDGAMAPHDQRNEECDAPILNGRHLIQIGEDGAAAEHRRTMLTTVVVVAVSTEASQSGYKAA